MPRRVTSFPPISSLTPAIFGNASVVIIAVSVSIHPSALRPLTSSGMEEVILSTGRGSPMTPVDETYTVSSFIFNAFAIPFAVSFAFLRPSCPVQALALPLFIMTALPFPDLILSISRMTGAAFTAFLVNTAAADAGTSEYIRATSFVPAFFFIPHLSAETRKPGTLYSFSLRIFIAPP